MSSLRYDASHSRAGCPAGLSPDDSEAAHRRGRWGWSDFLSIVIPAKNEAPNLPILVGEIANAFRPLLDPRPNLPRLSGYEILVIDDGSTDETASALDSLRATHPELRPLRMMRNVGQSASTAAGVREARGEWIGILDADLQNHPADLAMLWDALPGHDAALGWRVKREDVWSKRIISRIANRIRNAVLGQSIWDTGCSVRIVSREMALRLPTFKGYHRFLGPLLLREGCRIVQKPVTHRPRISGKSNYHFWNRSHQVAVDLLGVAWLMSRSARYELAKVEPPLEPASRATSPHARRSATAGAAAHRQEAA